MIGYEVMTAADGAESQNVAIGYRAGLSIDHDDGDGNVLIGYQAGTGGGAALGYCVVIGSNAMSSTAANTQTGTIAIWGW
jgi:hypothetical protein